MVLSKRHTQWIFIEIIRISVLQVPFRGFRGLGNKCLGVFRGLGEFRNWPKRVLVGILSTVPAQWETGFLLEETGDGIQNQCQFF
jgi:hypothetical protein